MKPIKSNFLSYLLLLIGIAGLIIILLNWIDYADLGWDKNRGGYVGLISYTCICVSALINLKSSNT